MSKTKNQEIKEDSLISAKTGYSTFENQDLKIKKRLLNADPKSSTTSL